jgi:hypothetical protein
MEKKRLQVHWQAPSSGTLKANTEFTLDEEDSMESN